MDCSQVMLDTVEVVLVLNQTPAREEQSASATDGAPLLVWVLCWKL